jgi:6-phosphogluconate dehydrogenase
MEIGIIGLGKMGGNMARRLSERGQQVFGYNRGPETTQSMAEAGILKAAYSIEDLTGMLSTPRAIWVMVPAGEPTETTVFALADILSPDDVIIDGGNSFYKDSIRRAAAIQEKGIYYLDVGTSGGIWGLAEGYSLMIGGDPQAVGRLRPVFESLAPAPDQGWGHVGPNGAGHFTKMVHNGIEYGMMQAYAEGFEILKNKPDLHLDTHQIAEIWRYGSVVRSWLLDLIARALALDPDFKGIEPWVADSGEGRWTVLEAIDLDVPAPVITLALQERFASRRTDSYGYKMLAAMRNQFGGHEYKKAD